VQDDGQNQNPKPEEVRANGAARPEQAQASATGWPGVQDIPSPHAERVAPWSAEHFASQPGWVEKDPSASRRPGVNVPFPPPEAEPAEDESADDVPDGWTPLPPLRAVREEPEELDARPPGGHGEAPAVEEPTEMDGRPQSWFEPSAEQAPTFPYGGATQYSDEPAAAAEHQPPGEPDPDQTQYAPPAPAEQYPDADQYGYRNQDPYAHDPYPQEPYTQEPYTQDPNAQEAYAQDRYSQDPYGADPYTQASHAQAYAQDPEAQEAYTQDPQAQDPYQPQAGHDPYAPPPYGAPQPTAHPPAHPVYPPPADQPPYGQTYYQQPDAGQQPTGYAQSPPYGQQGYQQPAYQPPPPSHQPSQAPPLPAQPMAPPPTAEEFAARRAHKPRAPEATMGMPALIRRVSFGVVAPAPSKREREYRDAIKKVRRNFGGLRQITVVNPKGGAGKTVAALMIAMTFGQSRGGYVLAWDNNETQGTLGMRAQQDFHTRTVRDVLHDLDTFMGIHGRVGDLSSYVRSQAEAMFDVLASDESATAGEMLTAAAFADIREVVSRFYKLIIVDTGNNVRAENWQAAIDATDQLVVTMSARGDSAETAARMLDHLEQTGREQLVRQAVSVVTMPASKKGVDLPAIQRHFAARTRQVIVAPYERLLDSGEPIRYGEITQDSRDAWLKIAAAIAEAL